MASDIPCSTAHDALYCSDFQVKKHAGPAMGMGIYMLGHCGMGCPGNLRGSLVQGLLGSLAGVASDCQALLVAVVLVSGR